MKPLKTKVSITLDSEIIDEIKILAEEDDRSFSQYVNLVLKENIFGTFLFLSCIYLMNSDYSVNFICPISIM